jgi:hypothetical protein
MTTLMRNGRDRRLGRPAYGPREARTREIGWDPIRGLHQGQRPLRLHRDEASLRAKTGRIHGCTRTLRKKSDLLLQRGHRPYMALSERYIALQPNVRFWAVSSTGRRNTPRWSAPTVGAGAISPLRAKTLDTALVLSSGSGVIRQYWQLFQPSQRVAFSCGMNRVRACPSICMPFQRGGLE